MRLRRTASRGQRREDTPRRRPNKGMKLTKLSAAPFRGAKCRLMPAPAGLDAGTASQLIPGVRRTCGVEDVTEGGWSGLDPE